MDGGREGCGDTTVSLWPSGHGVTPSSRPCPAPPAFPELSPLMSRKSSAITAGPLSMGLAEPLNTRPVGTHGLSLPGPPAGGGTCGSHGPGARSPPDPGPHIHRAGTLRLPYQHRGQDLVPITISLCPHVPITLSPCPHVPITLSLYPQVPITLCPCPHHPHHPVPVSPCPHHAVPVSPRPLPLAVPTPGRVG